MSLLRKETIEYQNNTSHGEIIIPASFGISFSAVTTLLLLLLIALFLYFGSYTRKAHLTGIVMPSSGLIKITPQYAGNVTSLTIQEGQHVMAGEALYHLSGEHYNDQGTGTLAAMSLSLKTQHAMLVSQQTLEQHDNTQQQQANRQRIAALQPQINSAVQRLSEAERQAELATAVMSRYRKLLTTHYVSDVEFQQKQIEVSSAQENVENQRQALLQLRSAQDATEDDLNHLIAQGKSRQNELDRQLQGLQQQLIELTGQEHFTLTAPVSGTVAAVLIRQGQSVKSSEAVMTLVPDNARLQIELYATSQNAGFIQPGQRVALRFAAFPYQKFGVQYGTIREISRTTLTPSDLLSVSPVTWKENEGHYRVIVEPENTFILAYGKKEPLRPGMALEGDVSLDTRHLWEWLTEPLWSLRGKL
ncbi:HlyD family efflux transporter periplasmic adaptor subunit [Klebsiella pneumoniae]|uniref:HlyD family secretion protein n=1 Tax=Klebsiella pneumoniae TaxID=573 RepID=UPI0007CC1023|nr:HlyD family efflux transporter periplasmic adaptor subunit [Klebsiella pneumoniae]MCH9374049.1 HlyD family secretion protein [Klebsiella pneumoniae]MCH9481181.1 HlyD family secretion protein [Klebsiella pneumoniae]SBH70848.1 microcin E492 secretion protein MceH [Klebsiella pneumoniae]HBR1277118.1 HlyD family efflux transporter periplasmic adaptor subunit [Klebsiella pneumoniae]HBR1728193.1 HlyD family efflux transporter periplasmic adaptor subunit [Klebsiella pneumoniae]